MKIICTVCGLKKEKSSFERIYKNKKTGWCSLCRNTSRRERYLIHKPKRSPYKYIPEKYREIYRKHIKKIKARQKLKYAVISGRIKKEPCSICGNIESQAHHPDYSQPLLVVWLCCHHHRSLHRNGQSYKI